jgi:hypothetical protein
VDLVAIGSGDAGRFLASMLEGVESEEGEASYVVTGCVYAKDSALFAERSK